MRSPIALGSGLEPILFAVYTVASVAGLLLLKAHMAAAVQAIRDGIVVRIDVVLVVVGAGLYVLSFLVWLVILSRLELSVAYPIAIGLTLVCSTIAATVLLGEAISPTRAAGIGIVFLGVWLITRS